MDAQDYLDYIWDLNEDWDVIDFDEYLEVVMRKYPPQNYQNFREETKNKLERQIRRRWERESDYQQRTETRIEERQRITTITQTKPFRERDLRTKYKLLIKQPTEYQRKQLFTIQTKQNRNQKMTKTERKVIMKLVFTRANSIRQKTKVSKSIALKRARNEFKL